MNATDPAAHFLPIPRRPGFVRGGVLIWATPLKLQTLCLLIKQWKCGRKSPRQRRVVMGQWPRQAYSAFRKRPTAWAKWSDYTDREQRRRSLWLKRRLPKFSELVRTIPLQSSFWLRATVQASDGVLMMMRHLPGKLELIALFTMAAVCTVVISLFHARDEGLFFLAFPLFLVSAILGLIKSGRLRADGE